MAESIFKIKVSNGLINIELEGKSEIVIEQFNEIRRAGLENFLTGSTTPSPAPIIAKKAAEAISQEVTEVVKKKRGRKPKVQEDKLVTPELAPVVELVTEKKKPQVKTTEATPKKTATPAVKKMGRPKKTATAIAEVIADVEPVKPVAKKTTAPKKGPIAKKTIKSKAPKATTKQPKKEEAIAPKPAATVVKKEVKTKAPVAKEKQAKVIAKKEPKAPKAKMAKAKIEEPVNVNLNLLPTLEEVCSSNRPGPEREWIMTYALYASEFGKKTITRDDIVLKYEETNRKDQSRINNLTNNIANAIKKGWIHNPEDKKLYITAEGITMAYTVAMRTAPVKEKKTGKAPKKTRTSTEQPASVTTTEVPAVVIPTPIITETAQDAAKTAKKAKSISIKKAKSKKKPVKKPIEKKVKLTVSKPEATTPEIILPDTTPSEA